MSPPAVDVVLWRAAQEALASALGGRPELVSPRLAFLDTASLERLAEAARVIRIKAEAELSGRPDLSAGWNS